MRSFIQLMRFFLPIVCCLALIAAAIVLGISQDVEKYGQLAYSVTIASYFFAFADYITALTVAFGENGKLAGRFDNVSQEFFSDSKKLKQRSEAILERLNCEIIREESSNRPRNIRRLKAKQKKIGKVHKRAYEEVFDKKGVMRMVTSLKERIAWMEKLSVMLAALGVGAFFVTLILNGKPNDLEEISLTVSAFALVILSAAFKTPQGITICMRLRELIFNTRIKRENVVCEEAETLLEHEFMM